MYYKGVNRGLHITKPGRYAIGLIFLMGLLAIMSALNAFFLFLSIGLGMLIISGVLSEKQIKHVTSQALEFRQADAGQAFPLTLRLTNTHPRHHLYGMASWGFESMPNLRKRRWPAHRLESFALKIPANETVPVEAQVSGLARGVYRHLHVLHKTSYPFGLMEKFKLESAACHLRVVPAFLTEAAEAFRQHLRETRSRPDNDGDFYGHRPYQGRETLALIDWKKSARQPQSHWLVKRYINPVHARAASIQAPWLDLIASDSAETYETSLSELRTLCDVIHDEGFHVRLHIQGRRYCATYEESLDGLAMLPDFARRRQRDDAKDEDATPPAEDALVVRYQPGTGITVSSRRTA